MATLPHLVAAAQVEEVGEVTKPMEIHEMRVSGFGGDAGTVLEGTCPGCGSTVRVATSQYWIEICECGHTWELAGMVSTPPSCFYCDDGWERVKQDRRRSAHRDHLCGLDEAFCHIHPDEVPE